MFSALFKKEVGPYVLGQLLGTGATSTVHLGEHKDTKKLVPATNLSQFAHFAAHRGCQVAIKMVKRTQKSRLHDSVFEREVLLRPRSSPPATALTPLLSGERAQAALPQQPASAGVNFSRRRARLHVSAHQPTFICVQGRFHSVLELLVSAVSTSRSVAECWSTRQAATCWVLSCLREVSGAVKILGTIPSYCSTSSLPPTLCALHSHPSCSTIDTHHSLSSLTISCRYIHQLLDGVQFLHDSNFVHRDLKLENLMIDACGCLKIGQANMHAARSLRCSRHHYKRFCLMLQSQATSV